MFSTAIRSFARHLAPALFGLALIATSCSKHSAEAPPAAAEEKHAESRVKHGPNGETILMLDAETQKTMDLQIAPVAALELAPEIKGYGRVLDPAPLAALITELAAAGAAAQASEAELKRLKSLAAQDNASQRSLETAQAAASHDLAQAESVRLRLIAAWGGAIASRPDLPEFAHSLVTLENALVQIDLPAGESVQSPPASARLATLAGNSNSIQAGLLGPAPAVDPQTQGQGFLFLVKPNSSRLAPGAALTGMLPLPGAPQAGVLLPRNAILRFNGFSWVYVQSSETTFQRTQVTLDRSLEDGWFVREGLKPQDKVVAVGAQLMLSEEVKGQGGE